MKDNLELERSDIEVYWDMDYDSDKHTITAYLETWFDVDAKFGIHSERGECLNLYADYNPFDDLLSMKVQISDEADTKNEFREYRPTEAEAQLIKDMIAQKIKEVYGQTPQEFCSDLPGMEAMK